MPKSMQLKRKESIDRLRRAQNINAKEVDFTRRADMRDRLLRAIANVEITIKYIQTAIDSNRI